MSVPRQFGPSNLAEELGDAAYEGKLAHIRGLLEAGADVNAKTRNGETVLGLARPYVLEVVELLKARGGR